jgi:hypothetical protein
VPASDTNRFFAAAKDAQRPSPINLLIGVSSSLPNFTSEPSACSAICLFRAASRNSCQHQACHQLDLQEMKTHRRAYPQQPPAPSQSTGSEARTPLFAENPLGTSFAAWGW